MKKLFIIIGSTLAALYLFALLLAFGEKKNTSQREQAYKSQPYVIPSARTHGEEETKALKLIAEREEAKRVASLTPTQRAAEEKERRRNLLEDYKVAEYNTSEDMLAYKVKVVKNPWNRCGFDSIACHSFTIENEAFIPLKDITVACKYFSESDTLIDTNVKTIYQVFKPKSKKTFSQFSMGFIHSQTSTSSCRVISVKKA